MKSKKSFFSHFLLQNIYLSLLNSVEQQKIFFPFFVKIHLPWYLKVYHLKWMTEINSRHKGQFISTYPKRNCFLSFCFGKAVCLVSSRFANFGPLWEPIGIIAVSSWFFLFEGFWGGFRNELVTCNNERKMISSTFQAEQATQQENEQDQLL